MLPQHVPPTFCQVNRYPRSLSEGQDVIGHALPVFVAHVIKRAEVMELCRLREGQAKRLLQRMLAAGQIVMRGQGKTTAYVEPQ